MTGASPSADWLTRWGGGSSVLLRRRHAGELIRAPAGNPPNLPFAHLGLADRSIESREGIFGHHSDWP